MHFANAHLLILVTESGIVTSLSDWQLEKVPVLISDIDGIVTCSRFEQYLKEYSPISVTDKGIEKSLSEQHFKKVRSSIFVIEEGIEHFNKFSQKAKALLPILFTEEGIIIYLSETHFSKA